jgi:colicin import membrane protein
MKPATMGAPYTVPPEPNRLPAIALALAVHALLLAFLWIGISWQNTEPPAVEAEVWDMKVQSAAAPALPPPPPEVQEPEPQPEPTPAPPPPPPKVAEPEPVKPAAPDINLEREKKLAEQKKQRERDLLEKKERERELAEKKEREEEREKLKAKELAEKKAQDKKELAKKEQEKKDLEKKLEEKKLDEKKLAAEKADAEKKKVAAEKAAKAKKDAAEQAKLDKQHDEELKRMMGAAGTTGSAQKSSAPKIDAGYVGKLTALIKSNTTFAGSTDVPGNPKAVFRVELLPTGEILSVRLSKSSGVPQFDDAVERGINKSSPLPKKKDGTVERTIVVNFSMKDLD